MMMMMMTMTIPGLAVVVISRFFACDPVRSWQVDYAVVKACCEL